MRSKTWLNLIAPIWWLKSNRWAVLLLECLKSSRCTTLPQTVPLSFRAKCHLKVDLIYLVHKLVKILKLKCECLNLRTKLSLETSQYQAIMAVVKLIDQLSIRRCLEREEHHLVQETTLISSPVMFRQHWSKPKIRIYPSKISWKGCKKRSKVAMLVLRAASHSKKKIFGKCPLLWETDTSLTSSSQNRRIRPIICQYPQR